MWNKDEIEVLRFSVVINRLPSVPPCFPSKIYFCMLSKIGLRRSGNWRILVGKEDR